MTKIKLMTVISFLICIFNISENLHAQCPTVTNLIVTDNQDGTITASWTPAGASVLATGFALVPLGFTPIASMPSGGDFSLTPATSVTIDTLYDGSSIVNGTTYTLVVGTICFSGGDSVSANVTINIPTLPCASVANLDTLNTNLAAGTIDFSFIGTASEYQIEVINNTAGTSSLVLPNVATSPVTLTSLIVGDNYTVRVKAICGVGDTAIATNKTFDFGTPASTCPPVSGLTIIDNQDGSVTATWTAPNPAPMALAYSFVPLGFAPNVSASSTDFTFSPVSPLTLTTTYNGASLVNGSTYTLILASICGLTDYDSTSVNVTINIPVTPCDPITLLDTLNADFAAGTIDLSFASTSSEFEVRVTNNTTSTTSFVTPNPTSSPISLSGLNLGDNYSIRVRAICGAGDTSSAVTKIFNFGTLPCQQATNVVVVDNNDGSITVSWVNPVPAPAQGMAISVMDQGQFPAALTDVTVNATSPFTTSTTTAGVTLAHDATYSVYVGSICDALSYDIAFVPNTIKIFNPAPCDTVKNLAVVDNTDGTLSLSWDAVSPIPAGGYGYAIVEQGTIPVSADFKPTTNTSVVNVSATTNAAPIAFLNGRKYDVYVRTHCSYNPVWFSDSVKTTITVTHLAVGENEILLNIYPNPVVESVVVNANNLDLSNATIVVLDITGKVLSTTNMVSSLTTLDMSNFAAGVYFVKVQSGVNMNIVKVVKK